MQKNNFDFTFCNYEKIISKRKKIKVVSPKPTLNYMDLLKSNEIGLSTVQLSKKIILDDLFPPLKTKEDYVCLHFASGRICSEILSTDSRNQRRESGIRPPCRKSYIFSIRGYL